MAHNKKEIRNRKFRKYQRVATRLLVMISILVLMGTLAFRGLEFGFKMASTQAKMVYYYMQIRDEESNRDYNNEMASMYPHIPTYRNDADEADTRVETLTEERKVLRESEDPVIAFAAKNYVDFTVMGISLVVFVLMGFAIFGMYKSLGFFVTVGEVIFNGIIHVVFMIGAAVAYAIHLGCYKVSMAFYKSMESSKQVRTNRKYVGRYCRHREDAPRTRSNGRSEHNNGDIIEFPGRRIG